MLLPLKVSTLKRPVSAVTGWKYPWLDFAEKKSEPVEVWAEDETRLGLLPVHRRVWAKKGVRPTAPVCPAYKWLYGFGFVRPQTGETDWLLMPTVSVEVMNLALAEFARDVNPEAKKQIVLLVDRAGFHTSKAV